MKRNEDYEYAMIVKVRAENVDSILEYGHCWKIERLRLVNYRTTGMRTMSAGIVLKVQD